MIEISNYKYTCNEDYFETIDTEDKAYWLGFIYADGNVTKKETALRIMLHTRDSEHLHTFLKHIGSNHKTFIRRLKEQDYIGIDIVKMNLVRHLIAKGCMPNKTRKLKFPPEDILPSYLHRHFIRGYFDGDGCVATRFRTQTKNMKLYMDCVFRLLGTYDMMENIIRIIPVGDIKLKELKTSKGIFQFDIYDRKKVITLMDYLYEDTQLYLRRKHEKYIEEVKHYKTP